MAELSLRLFEVSRCEELIQKALPGLDPRQQEAGERKLWKQIGNGNKIGKGWKELEDPVWIGLSWCFEVIFWLFYLVSSCWLFSNRCHAAWFFACRWQMRFWWIVSCAKVWRRDPQWLSDFDKVSLVFFWQLLAALAIEAINLAQFHFVSFGFSFVLSSLG